MLKLLRSALCTVRGHDYQRMPSLHTSVCRRCGSEHPDAFWHNPGLNPAMHPQQEPVSLLHEQTTPPETLRPEELLMVEQAQEITAQPQHQVPPQHSVYLSDGSIIAQNEWDALLAAGRVTMLPSGRLLIEKQK